MHCDDNGPIYDAKEYVRDLWTPFVPFRRNLLKGQNVFMITKYTFYTTHDSMTSLLKVLK